MATSGKEYFLIEDAVTHLNCQTILHRLFAAQTRILKPKNRLKPIAQGEVQVLSHFDTDIHLAQTVLEEKKIKMTQK